MNKLSNRVGQALATASAGLASASPALAALPFEVPFSGGSMHLQEWLLSGSLALLAVALALRLIRLRSSGEPVAEGPDLRWWRNPGRGAFE